MKILKLYEAYLLIIVGAVLLVFPEIFVSSQYFFEEFDAMSKVEIAIRYTCIIGVVFLFVGVDLFRTIRYHNKKIEKLNLQLQQLTEDKSNN